MSVLLFFVQAVVISMSGVLAPGPVTTASIMMGMKNRYAGSLISIGHGIVEFPLIILITLGLGKIFEFKIAQIIIGFAGGAMLLFMAYGIYKSSKAALQQGSASVSYKPVMAGMVLSASNPFFLVWWATTGLALALQAKGFGIWAFAVFAIVHWSCDLVWYQALSWASFKGSTLLNAGNFRSILIGCSVAMFLFGLNFVFNSSCILFLNLYYAKLINI